MKHKSKFIFRLFLALFTLSVSMTTIPGRIIPAYGLFGEVKASAVTRTNWEDTEEVAVAVRKCRTVKRINRYNKYNIWFKLAIIILCLTYAAYEIRLPRRGTTVTLKVRMNN